MSQLGHQITNTKRRFIIQHLARQRQIRAGADRHQHRSIATLAGELAQVVIDVDNSLRSIRAQRVDDLFVKDVRLRIVTSRRVRLEPVTQVATRNESDAPADSIDRVLDTRSKTQVIFV